MIDWGAGYSSEWRVYRVDRATWADAGEVGGVSSLRVERDGTGDAPALERGSVEVDLAAGESLDPGYYRFVMLARQGAAAERVDVATLLCEATSADVGRGVSATSATGRSVLHPASESHLAAGSYAPAGADGARWAADLLRDAVNAPVSVADGASFSLDQHVVLDPGCSVLQAAWLVLRAGGRVMQVGGRGEVTVMAPPAEPALVLDRAAARLVHPGVTRALDLSGVPNRYVAVSGSEVAEAVNDDPSSPTSTVTRGWTCDVVDRSPVRVGGETLAAYAARRLEEESAVPDERSYEREWWPGVLPFSLVRGTMPSVGIDGDLRVTRQSLACGRGIVVEEQASREVRAWQRN